MKWAAPTLRIGLLIGVGALILYALGRYDGMLNEREAALRRETKAVLAVTLDLRQERDSLAAVEDSLAARDEELGRARRAVTRALRELAARDRHEMDSLAQTPVASLLPPLRLRPFFVAPDTLYGTDEGGVRFLAGRMLRLAQTTRELEQVRRLADTTAAQVLTLRTAFETAQSRADRAELRIQELEPLLEDWVKTRQCRILWLVPCPSRTVAFLGGIGVGVGGILLLGSL